MRLLIEIWNEQSRNDRLPWLDAAARTSSIRHSNKLSRVSYPQKLLITQPTTAHHVGGACMTAGPGHIA